MKKPLLITGGIMLGTIFLGVLVLLVPRGGPQVGSFTSPGAKAEFQEAYDLAMRALPVPDKMTDLETSYGTVRVYYFATAETSSKEPLLLLPGRSASTPMWESNLAGLMQGRPVYSIDLLGEPG